MIKKKVLSHTATHIIDYLIFQFTPPPRLYNYFRGLFSVTFYIYFFLESLEEILKSILVNSQATKCFMYFPVNENSTIV